MASLPTPGVHTSHTGLFEDLAAAGLLPQQRRGTQLALIGCSPFLQPHRLLPLPWERGIHSFLYNNNNNK